MVSTIRSRPHPLAAPHSRHILAPGFRTPRSRGVLVVDDEPIVRSLLARILELQGCWVFQAGDGAEAVEAYRRQGAAIDLVMMEVVLPRLDGPGAFAALREIDPEVRCCFMSGDPGEYRVEQLLRAGAVGFLDKPFSLAAVEAMLRCLAAETA
jgi:CheY-like chemotaxis protein